MGATPSGFLQRAFTRAVRAEKAENFTLSNGKRHVRNEGLFGVAEYQILYFNHMYAYQGQSIKDNRTVWASNRSALRISQ